MRGSPLDALADATDDRLDRLTRRVLAVALVALALRVVLLGGRVAHFDEGRVAWWTVHFLESGQFEYRYIIHGPLVQHVNKVLFGVFGASDAVMRLFIALVGAALPLSALLFREHLDEEEVLGVAAFLAVNPVLVYYSRFFRSTLLVAAFAFVAFGLLVRAMDERDLWYAQAAVVFVALAFAAKENAAVYLLCWLGASALILDHFLFRTGAEASGIDRLAEHIPDTEQLRARREDLPRYLGHLGLAAVLFVGVSLYFYAPRSPTPGAVGFWDAVTNPARFPALFDRTLADVVEGYEYWFGGSTDPGCRKDNVIDGYLCFLGRSLESLGQYALPLMALSVFGFLGERWGRPDTRWLVMFAGYWGFVSVLGYPLGTDIYGAWIMVNALVPLTIPAGVGLATLVRWTRESLHADAVRFGIAAFVVFLVVGQVSVALATGVYMNPTGDDNTLVQYAQPADDFRPAFEALEGRAGTHDGVDVLFVGSPYVRENARAGGIEPRCTSISQTLPLQWYVAMHDATGDCARSTERARTVIEQDNPIVVVAPVRDQDALAPMLEGYGFENHRLRTRGAEATFFYRNATGG
jgi:uncharacterized protein (TIGR03663 family)